MILVKIDDFLNVSVTKKCCNFMYCLWLTGGSSKNLIILSAEDTKYGTKLFYTDV